MSSGAWKLPHADYRRHSVRISENIALSVCDFCEKIMKQTKICYH